MKKVERKILDVPGYKLPFFLTSCSVIGIIVQGKGVNELHIYPPFETELMPKHGFESKEYKRLIARAKAKNGIATVVEHGNTVCMYDPETRGITWKELRKGGTAVTTVVPKYIVSVLD